MKPINYELIELEETNLDPKTAIQYIGKTQCGRLLGVKYRFFQFTVYLSKKPTSKIEEANFPKGNLVLNRIVPPHQKKTNENGVLKKAFIIGSLKKLGFKISIKE